MNDKILIELERDIKKAVPIRMKPLPIDRWLAASVLQKSIRRGDVKTAQRAALTLWHQDKQSLWMRLHIIALEDVGVASPHAVTKTLCAFNAAIWRSRIGDLKIALHITRLLCEADKIRLADEVYSIASRAAEYQSLRNSFAKAKDNHLAGYAMDQGKPLAERALATWFLAGTKRYPFDGMPVRLGNLDAAIKVLRSSKADKELTEACISSLKKSAWPLALWTPLLWTEVKKQPKTLLSWNGQPCPTAFIRGVPLVALDGFTRIGRTCFRQLQQTNPIFNGFTQEQIRLAAFYLQGRCLDKRLASPVLDEYRQAGELADLHAADLNPTRYAELKGIMELHMGMLEDIRERQIKSHLKQPQGELALGDAE